MPSLSPALAKLISTAMPRARGIHQALLDANTLGNLQAFSAFLVKEGKSPNTVRVYKSLVAKAVAQGFDPNNPVMKSAVNAFVRFAQSL